MEVLIATGLLSILAGALIVGIFNVEKNMRQVESVTTLNVLRMTILSHLQNDWSWKATVNALSNTDMICIKNQTSCAAQPQRPFKLHDAAGNLVYDASIATNGFATNGELCNTYNDSTGNDTCAYRAELTWQPDCAAPCIPSGLVKISVTLKYNPQTSNLIKILSNQHYNIEVARKAVAP